MDLLSRSSSVRHPHVTEEIKQIVLSKETEVAGAISSMDDDVIEVIERLQGASSVDPDEGADGKFMVHQENPEERVAVEGIPESVGGNAVEDPGADWDKQHNVHTSESGEAAGLTNTQGKYVNVNITIDNAEATKGGKVIARIVEGRNLGGFFKELLTF